MVAFCEVIGLWIISLAKLEFCNNFMQDIREFSSDVAEALKHGHTSMLQATLQFSSTMVNYTLTRLINARYTTIWRDIMSIISQAHTQLINQWHSDAIHHNVMATVGNKRQSPSPDVIVEDACSTSEAKKAKHKD